MFLSVLCCGLEFLLLESGGESNGSWRYLFELRSEPVVLFGELLEEVSFLLLLVAVGCALVFELPPQLSQVALQLGHPTVVLALQSVQLATKTVLLLLQDLKKTEKKSQYKGRMQPIARPNINKESDFTG